MARVRWILLSALLVPAGMLAADPQSGHEEGAETRRSEEQPLAGQYEITAGEKDGEPIPEDRLKDNSVTITEDTFAVIDRDKKELYSAKYKLKKEDEKGVWEIDLESKVPQEGAKAIGLLKRDGEEVWLIYSLNEERPVGFGKAKRGQHLFKMTRVEKDGDAKAQDEKDSRRRRAPS